MADIDIKKALLTELARRQAAQKEQISQRDSDLMKLQQIAEIGPEGRTDLRPTAAFIDSLTGSNIARSMEAPRNVEQDLRTLINARMQQRKEDPMAVLGALVNMESAVPRQAKEVQRMRESALKTKQGQGIVRDELLKQKAQNYQDLVNKYGHQVTGPARAELEGAYRELQIAYKNAAELGVIAGPDMMLIEGIAPPSTGIGGFFKGQYKGGKEGVNRAINELKSGRDREISLKKQVLSSAFPGIEASDMFSMQGGQPAAPQPQQDINSLDLSTMSEEQLKKLAGY